jgi:hypothetical protein
MYDCVTSRADRTQITDWIGLIFGVYVSELVHMMDVNQILRSFSISVPAYSPQIHENLVSISQIFATIL